MRVFWQERRSGQRLILLADDDSETEVGAVRQTPRGFDALAKTNTYDPGRAQKGFPSIEEAKAFVEEFHPWDIFGGDYDLEVEPEVRRLPTEDSTQSEQATGQAAEPAEASSSTGVEPGDSMAQAEAPASVADEPSHAAASSEPVEASSSTRVEPGDTMAQAKSPASVADEPSHAAASSEPAGASSSTRVEPGDTMAQAEAPASVADEPSHAAAASEPSALTAEVPGQPAVEEKQPRKRGWRFWTRG